jgi:nucleotide-binding universal stress UspA family protein
MSKLLIAHTTDLSGEDELAFVHAVALARACGARLASVHASVGPTQQQELPRAAALLARWGCDPTLLEHQRIVHECCDDAGDTLLDAFRRLRPDLVIAATHARLGLERLFAGSVAGAVAKNLSCPVLLLPLGPPGFVDPASGRIRLRRVFVCPGGQQAWRLFAEMTGTEAELVAAEPEADLVVMSAPHEEGLPDLLFGSAIERLLHDLGRPVLHVPLKHVTTGG